MDDLVVFCADVGSVKSGNFGWARTASDAADVLEHETSLPSALARAVINELAAGRRVALGFEAPLFVPVPQAEQLLGAARTGEGSRAWSAGAGTGALATGLVQVAWTLRAIRAERPLDQLHIDWATFASSPPGLLVWEAFVSGAAKGSTHVEDAAIAVAAFSAALPDPTVHSSIAADNALSLVAACALWSGWSIIPDLLKQAPLAIRA